MIYIPLSEIKAKIPDDWFASAAQALADVTMITDPQKRAQAINDQDDVWKALQERLAALHKDKCWYCESNDSRSDRPMDHYRPKNALAECEPHWGYWWLAFAWDNFRYCCIFCNSKRVDKEHGTRGGKHDHFPIWRDGIRAMFGKLVQMTWNAKSQCCLIRAAKLTRLSSGSMKMVSLHRIPIYAGHRGLSFPNASRRRSHWITWITTRS